VHDICGDSEIVKSGLSQTFSSTLRIRSSFIRYRRPADCFVLHRQHLFVRPISEHSTPLSYSCLTHYISAVNSMRKNHGGFRRKKITLLRQEQTLSNKSYVRLQGNESCDATAHARAFPPSLHSLHKLNGGYFLNSPRSSILSAG
jgi:hypothetical protein